MNSLCQFWNDSNQNWEVPEVLPGGDGVRAVRDLLGAVLARARPGRAGRRRPGTGRRTCRPASSRRPSSTQPPWRTGHGTPGSAARRPRVLVLGRRLVDRLGLRRPALEEVRREHDVHGHLEELALPVLEGRLEELAGAQVLQQRDRGLAVVGLVAVVAAHPGQHHADEEGDEQREVGQQQAVVPQPALQAGFLSSSAHPETVPAAGGAKRLSPAGAGSSRSAARRPSVVTARTSAAGPGPAAPRPGSPATVSVRSGGGPPGSSRAASPRNADVVVGASPFTRDAILVRALSRT